MCLQKGGNMKPKQYKYSPEATPCCGVCTDLEGEGSFFVTREDDWKARTLWGKLVSIWTDARIWLSVEPIYWWTCKRVQYTMWEDRTGGYQYSIPFPSNWDEPSDIAIQYLSPQWNESQWRWKLMHPLGWRRGYIHLRKRENRNGIPWSESEFNPANRYQMAEAWAEERDDLGGEEWDEIL